MVAYKYRHRETYKGTAIDVKANTVKELTQKIQKRKEKIDSGVIDGNTLLLDFGRRYIDTYKKPAVSGEWYKGLVLILEKHIAGRIGNKRMKDIRQIEVQQMLNSLEMSDAYMGKIFNLSVQIFHAAYRNRLTESDFSEDLIKPKGYKNAAGKALTQAEQDAMLKVCRGHRGETLVLVMYYCGLRTMEARNLQWLDVDWDSALLHIRGTKTKNADRIVPIPDVLLTRLKELYDGDPFGFVCLHDKQQAVKAWRNIKRLMNIELGCRVYRNQLVPPYPVREGLRLYDLRHTYCTNLELARVPLSIASRLMGHSDISITAKIYTHGTDESIEIARNLINGKRETDGKEIPVNG